MSPIEYYASVTDSQGNNARLEANTQIQKQSKFGAYLGSILSTLEQRGYIESIMGGRPMRNGLPVPLLTFPFLDFFESHDWKEFRLIEFGSGNSTIYFESKFAKIHSFETNPEWYENVRRKLVEVEYQLISVEDLHMGNFDIKPWSGPTMALIDSACNRRRVASRLLEKMRPEIVVLDNSEWYQNTTQDLVNSQYLHVPFWGLKCSEHWESCTSIFFDMNANINLKRTDVMPPPLSRRMQNDWDK
jgi:hypothetical protein